MASSLRSIFYSLPDDNAFAGSIKSRMNAGAKLILGERESVKVKSSEKAGKDQTDKKLKRIINKFNAGKKLTQEELEYVAAHAPEIYQKILRITMERNQLEQELKNASTKEEADNVKTFGATMMLHKAGDEFEQSARASQFRDAIQKYNARPESLKKADMDSDDDDMEKAVSEYEDFSYEDSCDMPYEANGKRRKKKEDAMGRKINYSV